MSVGLIIDLFLQRNGHQGPRLQTQKKYFCYNQNSDNCVQLPTAESVKKITDDDGNDNGNDNDNGNVLLVLQWNA